MSNVPEKHRAVAHKWVDGAVIEWRVPETDDWQGTTRPAWDYFCEYRVAPTKPSINWGHVAPEWNYLATDRDGITWLLNGYPTICGGEFRDGRNACERADVFASFKRGTCDWEESLVARPGFKGETNETN